VLLQVVTARTVLYLTSPLSVAGVAGNFQTLNLVETAVPVAAEEAELALEELRFSLILLLEALVILDH